MDSGNFSSQACTASAHVILLVLQAQPAGRPADFLQWQQSAPEEPVVPLLLTCALSRIVQPNPFGGSRFCVAFGASFLIQTWWFPRFICCCMLSDLGRLLYVSGPFVAEHPIADIVHFRPGHLYITAHMKVSHASGVWLLNSVSSPSCPMLRWCSLLAGPT